MTTLWDTTGTDVVKALSVERRQAGSVASGLALTLVVVVDDKNVAHAEQAAMRAAAQHPCRLLVVVRRKPEAAESRLDAEVLIGGRLGPGESVVMRMYGRLALHAESVVLPLLAPDAPVVTWWFGEPPVLIAHDPLGVIADRRVTDTGAAHNPMGALLRRAQDYVPGDTDLAWARITPWRSVCATAFDSISGMPDELVVTGQAGPSRALLAGWLTARLGLGVTQVDAPGTGVHAVRITVGEDVYEMVRKDSHSVTATHRSSDQGSEVGERTMVVEQPDLGDLLAEELRRLDPDEPYADALSVVADLPGLSDRVVVRTHIWEDPALTGEPDPALTTS